MRLRPIGAVQRWRWTRRPDSAPDSDPSTAAPTSEPTPLLGSLFRGARFRFGRLGRRTAISVVVLAAAALAAASLLPIRQYRDQGKSIDRAEQELRGLQEQRERLQFLLERAQDPEVREREARRQLSLVRPGDEIFRVVVPADIINLPPGWHLPGVKHLVAGES